MYITQLNQEKKKEISFYTSTVFIMHAFNKSLSFKVIVNEPDCLTIVNILLFP